MRFPLPAAVLLGVCTGSVLADPPEKPHKVLDDLLVQEDDQAERKAAQRDADGQRPVVAVVVPHNNIFPALVVAQAGMEEHRHGEEPDEERDEHALGDSFGVLGVGVVAPADNVPVRVVISAPSIMHDTSFETTLATEGETYSISPKIKWKYARLLRNRQQMPVDVSFRVKVADAPWKEITKTCTLRSVNDCLLAFNTEAGGEYTDTTWLYTAYVNEDHPWVDEVLRDALATGVVESFTGYQTEDPEEVLKQVYGVWRVLQDRGVRYSDISTVSAQKRSIVSQHVRFLDECVKHRQANCIDGTVMLASILRKIGIQTHIVTIPGHAFLTFRPTRDADDEIGLETTLLGRVGKEAFEQKEERLGKLFKILGETETYEEASFRSFEDAVRIGSERYRDNIEHFDESEVDPNYWFISVDEARAKGVRPLAYMPEEEKGDQGDRDDRGRPSRPRDREK